MNLITIYVIDKIISLFLIELTVLNSKLLREDYSVCSFSRKAFIRIVIGGG